MGQKECLDCLEDRDGWFTVQEIQGILDIHSCSVNDSLKRLHKGGFIEQKDDPSKPRGYLYKKKEN